MISKCLQTKLIHIVNEPKENNLSVVLKHQTANVKNDWNINCSYGHFTIIYDAFNLPNYL